MTAGAPSGPGAAVVDAELTRLAVQATDPYQLAAQIEAAGYTDRAVASRFGDFDVFELAERLFAFYHRSPPHQDGSSRPHRQRPRRCPSSAGDDRADDPAPRPAARTLARGLIYALPVVVSGESDHFGPSGMGVVLLVAALIGWGLGQGLAALGYQLTLPGAPKPARLLGGLTSAGAALFGLVVALWTDSPALAVAGALALSYVLAATSLLVLGRDGPVLVALLPAAALAAWALFLTRPADLGHGFARVALLSGALSAVLMTLAMLGSAAVRAGRGRRPKRHHLRTAGAHSCYGWAGAALVLSAVGTGGGSRFNPVVAALALSMGLAEVLLTALRRQGRQLLRRAVNVAGFHLRAVLNLGLSACVYLVALGGCLLLLHSTNAMGSPEPTGITVVVWIPAATLVGAAVGLMFFCSSFLVAAGRGGLATLALALSAGGWRLVPAGPPATTFGLVAALVLALLAARAAATPTSYR